MPNLMLEEAPSRHGKMAQGQQLQHDISLKIGPAELAASNSTGTSCESSRIWPLTCMAVECHCFRARSSLSNPEEIHGPCLNEKSKDEGNAIAVVLPTHQEWAGLIPTCKPGQLRTSSSSRWLMDS
jgi:hypothetical protein